MSPYGSDVVSDKHSQTALEGLPQDEEVAMPLKMLPKNSASFIPVEAREF